MICLRHARRWKRLPRKLLPGSSDRKRDFTAAFVPIAISVRRKRKNCTSPEQRKKSHSSSSPPKALPSMAFNHVDLRLRLTVRSSASVQQEVRPCHEEHSNNVWQWSSTQE